MTVIKPTLILERNYSMRAKPPNARFVNPPALLPPNGYTHAVEVTGGRTMYISGQIAMNADGQIIGPGICKPRQRTCLRTYRPRSKLSEQRLITSTS
ncbi:MAG: RidA family protein [Chloroflexi bacterium AL-W]|nr:RidA family protein [Chloroflexi bacterium AL-N1]NOK65993.1 RidA family protein [Chloroflexi bacterium AL-N10]NOK72874.1 RidA family protein [Chloroflexi bacterium AL-N5]NOK79771.1 RidA family protein [Chloroflexi bacterium AL-W]NOK88373.1 RidA family protein [Chloroflexi bacterium AL-N15]